MKWFLVLLVLNDVGILEREYIPIEQAQCERAKDMYLRAAQLFNETSKAGGFAAYCTPAK